MEESWDGACVATGSVGIIPDFTIVNYRWIINTLVSAKFPSSSGILSHGKMQIAAKPDAKSGYISIPDPYCVFTTVNRNEAMNIYHANNAKPAAVPEVSGIADRVSPGLIPVRPVERFGGIRSSGQYCCHKELAGTGTQMTARRGIRGRTAVDGMCP